MQESFIGKFPHPRKFALSLITLYWVTVICEFQLMACHSCVAVHVNLELSAFFFVPCWTLKWLSYKTLMSIFCWDCQGTHCIIMQSVLFIQSVKSRQGTLDSAIGALSHPSLSWTVLTITMIDGWVISTAHLFSSLLAQTHYAQITSSDLAPILAAVS